MTVYNQVVRVGPRLWWRSWRRPRVYLYEATFYSSGYGMGSVTALTRRKCQQRYDQMRGEFYA